MESNEKNIWDRCPTIVTSKDINVKNMLFNYRFEKIKDFLKENEELLNKLIQEDFKFYKNSALIIKGREFETNTNILKRIYKNCSKYLEEKQIEGDLVCTAYVSLVLDNIESKPVVNCKDIQYIVSLGYKLVDYGVSIKGKSSDYYLSLKVEPSLLTVSNVYKSRLPGESRIFQAKIFSDFFNRENFFKEVDENTNVDIMVNLLKIKNHILDVLTNDRNKIINSLFAASHNLYINSLLDTLSRMLEVINISDEELNKKIVKNTIVKDYFMSLSKDKVRFYPRSGYVTYTDNTTKPLSRSDKDKLETIDMDYNCILTYLLSGEKNIVLKDKPRYVFYLNDIRNEMYYLSQASIFTDYKESGCIDCKVEYTDNIQYITLVLGGYYSNTDDKKIIEYLVKQLFKSIEFYRETVVNEVLLNDIVIEDISPYGFLKCSKDVTKFDIKIKLSSKEYIPFNKDNVKTNFIIDENLIENDIRKQLKVLHIDSIVF